MEGKINNHNPKKYQIILDEQKESPAFINIYQNEDSDKYLFYGILSPNVNKLYFVFKKQDETRLPLAIGFELNDEYFVSNQFQFLKHSYDKKLNDLDCIVIQFPDSELSDVYFCEVTPSFPFPVEISGEVKLKMIEQ